MTTVAQAEGGEALLQMQQQFLNGPLADYDAAELQAWRPASRSLWRSLQGLMTVQAGMSRGLASVDGHQLHFWRGGRAGAPTLLLLHGFGASRENWAFLLPYLRGHFQLLVPDLPGFGVSEFRYGADYSLAAQADRLALFLEQSNCDQVYVAGSSMGGAIAAQLAARHPQKVAALCLMNAAGAPGKRMSILESGVAAGKNYLAPRRRGDTATVMDVCLHRDRRLLGRALAWLMAGEMCHRFPVNHYLFQSLVTSLHDTWCQLPQVAAPTLVLWGDSDRVLDVTCTEAFNQRLPNSQVMVMPGVGHLPMLEMPQVTANILRDFWISKMELSV